MKSYPNPWLHRPSLLLTLFCLLLLASCSPQVLPTQTPISQVQNTAASAATATPPPAPTASPTEKVETPTATPIPPTLPPTPTVTATPFKPDVKLRITYHIAEYDSANEFVKSDLWVLYPPYQSPQLIYTTNKSNYRVLQRHFWAHDGRRLAFVHIVGDERHVALSVLDTQTGQVTRLTETFSLMADPYQMIYHLIWSWDDRWLYMDMNDGSIDSIIVNTQTKEVVPMKIRTQDELVAWSPLRPDEYAYISRRSFPEVDGDHLCLGRVGQSEPLACYESPDDQVLLGTSLLNSATLLPGSSWSLDWKKALIYSGPSKTNWMFDIQSGEWKPSLQGPLHYYSYWSPDGQWVVGCDLKKGVYLIGGVQQERQSRIQVSDEPDMCPLGWLPDSNSFVYSSVSLEKGDYAVYASTTDNPTQPVLVEDFTSLLKDYYYAQIDLLLPPPVLP